MHPLGHAICIGEKKRRLSCLQDLFKGDSLFVQFQPSSLAGEEDVMDKLTPARRSENMRRIRSKDTGPELVVRRMLRALGVGYRLHVRDLPGSPDIVMRRRRLIIFVHGCFWHHHPGCTRSFMPATRKDWWEEKLQKNVSRDVMAQGRLRDAEWTVRVIWECETQNLERLRERLVEIVFGGNGS